MMERISWNQYFMAQSHLLALRSTCTRLMVGATIVRDKRIIAGGYNGSPSGSIHCIDEGCHMVDGRCVRTIHAEANAILQCAKFGVATEGAHIYVTHYPCLQCTKLIIQSGIKHVYFAADYRNDPFAEQLFQETGVKTEKVPLTSLVVDLHYKEKADYINKLLEQLKNVSDVETYERLAKEGEQLFNGLKGR